MPELPEVETMRRGIAQIAGRRFVAARAVPCRSKSILIAPKSATFDRRVRGVKIDSVDRRGKRVVLRLENEHAIVIEPRMTGLVLVADPPSAEHLRFHFEIDAGPIREFWYWDRRGLGSVRLLSPKQFAAQLGPEKLGPDALETTPGVLRERLGSSRREIKVGLLDQRAVAGIGNLYASEILHLAQVHPARRCDAITTAQWQCIHDALHEVLTSAILHEGSTLSDGTYRNALNQAGGFQNQHRVYDRAGEACSSCGRAHIVRVVQAQRSTFFCPRCQRAPRNRR